MALCEYLGKCGGCKEITLEEKITRANALLEFRNFEVLKSNTESFRARAELSIYHKGSQVYFAMCGVLERFVCIENCKNLIKNIQDTLLALKTILNTQEFNAFRAKLFSLEILSNSKDSLLLSFIYHRKLDSIFLQDARVLRDRLQSILPLHFEIIGRCRGIKLVLENDFLIESLEILGKTYLYRYDDGAFTQPNPSINQKMITWVLEHLEVSSNDLLEMYCGCGNFTLPLAQKFRKVLATEISKTSIKAARFACIQNNILNIDFVRLSGVECIGAINGVREFNRLKEIKLEQYNFEAVFVDPPRAGLGENVCKFLQGFRKIIYISCNPNTLAKDLEVLKQTHRIIHCAFFDQFPNTIHLECGVILEKIEY